MAKGGKYLKQPQKKKGKAGKIILVILLILALIIGGVALFVKHTYDDIMKDLNTVPEVIETKEVSEEEIWNILGFNPAETAGAEDGAAE